MTPLTTARFRLLAAAVLFSTAGACIKATTLTSWQVASFRAGVAALTLFVALRPPWSGWSRRTLLVGFLYAIQMMLFVLSNKLTTAANSIFLQSTAPLYIMLLGPWLLREPIRGRDLALMSGLAAGLVLFFIGSEHSSASAPDPAAGNALAAINGVTWALTVLGLRWVATRDHAAGAVAATLIGGNLLACLLGLPAALPVRAASAADWALIGYLGVFQVSVAYLLVTDAVRHLTAFETSLLLLLEPVLNPIWAWIVHGERPGPWSLAGGAVILGVTVAKTAIDARRS